MSILIPNDGSLARLLALSACFVLLCGCGEARSGDDDPKADHHGHELPAHKPRTFPEAVSFLKVVNDRINRAVRDDQPTILTEVDPKYDHALWEIAADVAKWLPEIAGDCDMPEEPWNEVHRLSQIIFSNYQFLFAQTPLVTIPRDAGERMDQVNPAIRDLEAIVADADPRWFSVEENHPAKP